MSALDSARSYRPLVTSIAFFIGLAVLAIVFRRPLLDWFSGKATGGHEGEPVTAQAGPFAVRAMLDPDPPRQSDNALVLEVSAGGKATDDATVVVSYDMPAMGAMAEMKGGAKVSHEGGGHYRATFDLPMNSGTWTLQTTITSPAGDASLDLGMTIGNLGLSVASSTAGGAPSSGVVDHYTCAMHPSVNQPGPGKCPICGMNLLPVTKAESQEAVVTIDEARRQLIGVRTAPVVNGPMHATSRAVGTVAYDESALTDVNLKVHGWITKLYVNETGQRVARGQTLFELYSPELYNAEQDFLLATRGAMTVTMSGAASDGGARTDTFGAAARQRLRLLGLADAQVDALAKRGTPSQSIAFTAPASGFVIEKNVVEGASVDPGLRLYRIAALDKVWIEADVYEADLPNVHVGQRASVTLDYLPGRSYDAKVAYVYPYLDSKTRTGRVRIELANAALDLKPGMFANVALSADLGTRIQVPTSAVVYTGPRRLVFVDLGQGKFRPQEIEVGTASDGMVEVRAGLRSGDVVATSGAFLIAAEARLRTAATYWEPTSVSPDSSKSDAGAPQ